MNDHAMFAAALAEAGRPDIAATIDTRRAACVSVGRVIEQFPDDASVEVIVRAGWLVAQRSWDDLDGSVWALGFDEALVAWKDNPFRGELCSGDSGGWTWGCYDPED